MNKRNNIPASRRKPAAEPLSQKPRNKESKSARKRKEKEKFQFLFFASLFLPATILGAELSLFKHPATSRGIIQSVDLPTHTLLLVSKLHPEPITVTWVEDTEFLVEGVKSDPEKLQPQMKATVWTREPLVFPDKVLKISAYTIKSNSSEIYP